MSELDDEIAKEQAPKPKVCKVCIWYLRLASDVRESFDRHASSDIEVTQLFRACNRLNPPVGCAYATFSRHLRECLH